MQMNKLEIFPSVVFSSDLTDFMSETINKKIDHIAKNLVEEIPCCTAFWSKNKINNLLDLSKFEQLREGIRKEIFSGVENTYDIKDLSIKESFIVSIPKDGYLLTQKTFDSTFTTLINFSDSQEILLTNPNSYIQAKSFDSIVSNKYNSQYVFLPFEKNKSLTIPSSLHYGFVKVKEDLTFACITTH